MELPCMYIKAYLNLVFTAKGVVVHRFTSCKPLSSNGGALIVFITSTRAELSLAQIPMSARMPVRLPASND